MKHNNNNLKDTLTNQYQIILGTEADINELGQLYDDINDHLDSTINYPGWIKGVYPVKQTAIDGIQEGNLFVLKMNDRIAGSIILNHNPEKAYLNVKWGIEADYRDILVIHTFVVHPDFMKNGVGRKLIQFAKDYALSNLIKAIRLDVSIHNDPAISLYEKCHYQYVDTVDLSLNIPHLKWFKLYELIL